jgi:hypothetical protein
MKKVLKVLAYLFGLLLVGLLIFYLAFSESKPESSPSTEADTLAKEMLNALNKEAFDTLKYLQFDFAGRHSYLWHKPSNTAIIKWEENKVIMQLDSQKSAVYISEKQVDGDEAKKLSDAAWSYWCNDSFWMLAPFKAFDAGTERSIVNKDGEEGLMVSYKSGGVTPGDQYLWILNEDKIPVKYKMWVKIIPIGGTEATWEEWKTLKGGAKVSTLHKMKVFDLKMENVKEGDSYTDFGFTEDPFKI